MTTEQYVRDDWRTAAEAVVWGIRPFIDGGYREPSAADSFERINPATEGTLYHASAGSPADVDSAVRTARRRFDEGAWSRLDPVRRGEILVRFADLIVANKAEIALLDCLEVGKPIREALADAESYAPRLVRWWAGWADKLTGDSAPMSFQGFSCNSYEPRGVVGAITAWNFPVANAVIKVVPALAAGNSVVLKPSELSPSSALRLAELAVEAGIPEGVLNVVPGLGSTVGEALAVHPDVDMLTFTGSTTTGRKILALAAGSNGKPVLLECGGKSPHVVFGDVEDLDAVADVVAHGVVWNQGQVCVAHTRLIVDARIKDALLERVVTLAAAYAPGDPLDQETTFGPLSSPVQRDRVKRYIASGLQAGAAPVLRGEIQESGGCYVSPTIFDRVHEDMTIAKEEIFGPVLCVQSFEDEAEAIALANATQYGLAATVWTRDMARARRSVQAIRAGHVSIRTSASGPPSYSPLFSYEPQKASGFGSEWGLEGLKAYSNLKAIQFDAA